MQVDNSFSHPLFLQLPLDTQTTFLELIDKVNKLHLHCEDRPTWRKVHVKLTENIANNFFKCIKKQQAAKVPQPNPPHANAPQPPNGNPDDQSPTDHRLSKISNRSLGSIEPIHQKTYQELLHDFSIEIKRTFEDPIFYKLIRNSFIKHILQSLSNDAELALMITKWICINSVYLPLGTHLMESFKLDMTGQSHYFSFLENRKVKLFPEALSEKTLFSMKAFLAEAAQAHAHSLEGVEEVQSLEGSAFQQPHAVVLSVKNGAGGHTAPSQAMEARLKETGWQVTTIHYDTDLPQENDPLYLLGLTFEDGEPMTRHSFLNRWKMQKRMKAESRIVEQYLNIRHSLSPELFTFDDGGYLLRKKILPLRPKLIITTLAYHWSWKSLAFRAPTAKTLLVASDVFFHREGIQVWLRQRSLPPSLRKVHFTTMTEDLDLLKSMAFHHDQYFLQKYPNSPLQSMKPLFHQFEMDEQMSFIGAPINPAFEGVTDPAEIARLREKWHLPPGAVSVCISRGKLGYTSDLIPALEGYRTQDPLPNPLYLQVVCGENDAFYNRLLSGEFNDLGPNITVVPHPLRRPRDFAELRAISLIDDIKAGGGSTFEGWYLISKGARTLLLLTPGPKLWWENSNCDAMEKWGIGRTVTDKTGKIQIIKEVLEKGLPQIMNPFPDWKTPFDKVVKRLA